MRESNMFTFNISHQQNCHSLPQLPYNLVLLLPSLPANLPPQLCDYLQRVLVPSTKSVNNQGNEHNSLCLASFTVFPHFDVKGVLDSFFSFPGDLSNKLLLKWVDHRDIKRSIFAIGPEGEQDISRVGVGDVCFFLTMRCFNDAMFSNS